MKSTARPRGTRRSPFDELHVTNRGIAESLNGQVHARDWTLHHVRTYDRILIGLSGWPDKLLPRNGWVLDLRPEIHVDGQVIVPDIAGWRASRRVQPVEGEPLSRWSERCFDVGPDWICDIIEPSCVGLVRDIKPPIYLSLGVTNLWHVDRIKSTLNVHSADDGNWQLDGAFGGNGRLRAAPFKRVEFSLDGLWDRT